MEKPSMLNSSLYNATQFIIGSFARMSSVSVPALYQGAKALLWVIYVCTALLLGSMLGSCALEQTQSPDTPKDAGYYALGSGDISIKTLLDCLKQQNRQLIAGHRGTKEGTFPENSLVALQKTLEQAPVIFEIDIAATRDNRLVVFHDDTLERTTTGHGAIEDVSWSYLRSVRLKTDTKPTSFQVPLLADVLAWGIPHSFFQLDIKRSARYEDVITAIRRAKASHRVILISYSPGQAHALARKAPDMMISISISTLSDLNAYLDLGIAPARLVAWTGLDVITPALTRTLEHHGIAQIKGVVRHKSDLSSMQKALENATLIVSDFPVKSQQALAHTNIGICGISNPK